MIIKNERIVLGPNVPLQSDFSKNVEVQTNRGKQMDKMSQAETHKINTVTDLTWQYHMTHKLGNRQKQAVKVHRKPLRFTENVPIKMCILDLLQKHKNEI